MSRVEGPSFAEEMAVQSGPVSIWLDRMAFLHSAVHQHFAPTFPSVKSRLAANISVARQLRDVHRKALLAELAEMPEVTGSVTATFIRTISWDQLAARPS
jgi:hypothetical protein